MYQYKFESYWISLSSDVQLTEEAVRRYLIRKPMTTKDLLKKFQTKRTGLSSEQTVNVLAQILKRLNPERKNINDKMHFYLTEWWRSSATPGCWADAWEAAAKVRIFYIRLSLPENFSAESNLWTVLWK